MKFQKSALAAAGALVISTLPGMLSPAHAADWRTGWCQQDEGLSVVVDFGNEVADAIPAEGFLVRCLVGGVVEGSPELSRVAALEAVGLSVEADRSGYVTAVEGIEEYSGDAMWWFFSGAAVPAPWDTANHGIVVNGPNVNKALGARLVGQDWVSTPRPTPQFADPTPEPEPDPEPETPEVTGTVPVVTGTAQVGRQLTATLGSWSNGVTFARQWKRDGAPIRGARGASYRLTAADRGARISLEVTGSKPGHTSTRLESRPTAKIRAGQLTPATPRIAGKAKVGTSLTAVSAVWKPGQVKLTYRWLRDGKVIAGSQQKTYVVKRADVGHRISVRVIGTRPGYAKATRTSAKTVRVSR
ncbi:hypothetical protein GHK92_15630 [Nocardioides sp. dk4132]|uniref:hypothetical protein n=1 Tax=unclassified Nocardioides TaxID=2615069 RepID=UPI0012973384|nr:MULTISPECIES: hypothetical protein [unclassified Nocardioides]MQW77304.1 hypothetical protein [Nocardioides sp. dk4132]QGA08058.1 hypothetical protein GFH29_12105 [Nocardioides sp. dk884]